MARLEEEIREKAYRFYITDALRFITENTAKSVKEGKYLSKAYRDLPFFNNNQNKKPEEELKENQEKAEKIVLDFYNKIKEYQQ